MGEPTTERLDPDSDLYIRNALRAIRDARAELTAAIEVQPDEELLNAMESANLAAGSVEGGLNGILDMMKRRKQLDVASDVAASPDSQPSSGESEATTPESSGLPEDYAETAQ